MILRIIFCLCLIFVGGSESREASPEEKLRNELMRDYLKEAKPESTTTVTIRFTVLNLNMDERLQALDLDIWTSMEWEDNRFLWDIGQYPDISMLPFDGSQVWKPDVTIYNNANGKNEYFFKSQVLAMPNGHMTWVPPGRLHAACVMDMTYWPFDTHNCTAKFGSWVHHAGSINIVPKDDEINFEEIALNSEHKNLTRSEWQVRDTHVWRDVSMYDCCKEEYVSIHASIIVKRASPGYAWLVQMPAVVLSMMTFVVFLLPPSAGEKIILGGLTLLLDFFFLFSVSSLIGHPTSHTPLILELITKQLILTGTSVIISSIVLRLIRDPHSTGLPRCIKIPLLAVSTCLCLSEYRRMVASSMFRASRSGKGEDLELNEGAATRGLFPSDSKAGGDGDWLLLAAIIDRLCLIIFTVIFLFNMGTFYMVL